MIILDTNVVSEVMASTSHPQVVAWLNVQDTMSLYVTSVTIAEIVFGLTLLPQGKRKSLLQRRFDQFLERAFEGRVLPFDEEAARFYGSLCASRRSMGRPMANFDGQIAAIARTAGMALATRNLKDFRDCGIELIDPFADRQPRTLKQ